MRKREENNLREILGATLPFRLLKAKLANIGLFENCSYLKTFYEILLCVEGIPSILFVKKLVFVRV